MSKNSSGETALGEDPPEREEGCTLPSFTYRNISLAAERQKALALSWLVLDLDLSLPNHSSIGNSVILQWPDFQQSPGKSKLRATATIPKAQHWRFL